MSIQPHNYIITHIFIDRYNMPQKTKKLFLCFILRGISICTQLQQQQQQQQQQQNLFGIFIILKNREILFFFFFLKNKYIKYLL